MIDAGSEEGDGLAERVGGCWGSEVISGERQAHRRHWPVGKWQPSKICSENRGQRAFVTGKVSGVDGAVRVEAV